MTTPSDYESTLPKVFYALDELQSDHDQVDIATAAIEWGLDQLEQAGWSRERIRTRLAKLHDADPAIGGSA
jgi:hypothetical protein